MKPVAVPQQMLALQNMSGEQGSAPIPVWVGALLQSLPPVMREDVITIVTEYIGDMAALGQPTRIIIP